MDNSVCRSGFNSLDFFNCFNLTVEQLNNRTNKAKVKAKLAALQQLFVSFYNIATSWCFIVQKKTFKRACIHLYIQIILVYTITYVTQTTTSKVV